MYFYQMKKYGITGAFFLILFSCTNNNDRSVTAPDINAHANDSFFPVTSFIKGQIFILDSLPVTPLQITTRQNKMDSVWLPKNELKSLFKPFLDPIISETNYKVFFKETRFNDQTINAITFTYDPINPLPDSIKLRHWDVYINPETGKVMKVYLVKILNENNQSYTQQLTWQTDKLAKISTILNKPDGTMALLEEVVLIWNFN